MFSFAIPALAVLILGPVTMATQQGDPSASRLGSMLTRTVQDLKSVEELVHQIILPQLRHRLASVELPAVNSGCVVDYPYAPGDNGGRLTDDVETLAKLLPRLQSAAAFESNNRGGITATLLSTAVRKLKRVVSDYQAVKLAAKSVAEQSTGAGTSISAFIFGRFLSQGEKDPAASAPPPVAPPTPCYSPVTSVVQQYETILQMYVALVYATRDAAAVNNYYNSQ